MCQETVLCQSLNAWAEDLMSTADLKRSAWSRSFPPSAALIEWESTSLLQFVFANKQRKQQNLSSTRILDSLFIRVSGGKLRSNQGWSIVMCTTVLISDRGMRMIFQKLRSACHWNLRCISTSNIAEIWQGWMITIRPCSRICTLNIGCWRGWLGTKRGFHSTVSIRLPSKFYCSHAPGLREQRFFWH